MRVGIDYTAAIRQGAGVGRHVRSLVAAMQEEAPKFDQNFSFVLFYAGGKLSHAQQTHLYSLERQQQPNVRYVKLPFSEPALTRFWQRLRAPIPLEWVARFDNPFPFPDPLGKLDIIHFPDFALPPHRHGKGIVTIHDLSFLVQPECAQEGLRRYLTATTPRTVKRADRVIVVSESIKRELMSRYHTPESKIKVIYNGVGPEFKPIDNHHVLEEVRGRLGLPDRFALFVGTIEPRKNLSRLVEAWAEIKKHDTQGRKLVLAGKRGWLYEPIFRRISELGLKDEVIWLDFVLDADLPALYNLAEVFVFPSLYEGFGIPPLEALACGTPVLTADNSALAEVFDGAAVMVNALDVADIQRGLQTLLTDLSGSRTLANSHRATGLERARRYTWSQAARDTLEFYQEVVL